MEKGIILFDIDGTLLYAPGGRAAFAQAFKEAFGCGHADRAEIARQALKASGSTSPATVFLVGDTPNDISAARVNGFISIAVATGGFDVSSLVKAGADFVFKDLRDTQRVLAVLEQV